MLDHSEVPLAEPGKAGAVDLGVAADDVVHPGMEFASGSVEPLFRRLVPAVDEHRLGGPVLLLPRQPLAPLQYQDIDAPPRKRECGRAAAHPGADDDHFCAQRPHLVIQTWQLREHGSGTGSLEPSPSAEVLMSRRGAGARRIEILRWRCRDWLGCFAGVGRGGLVGPAPSYCSCSGQTPPRRPLSRPNSMETSTPSRTATSNRW